MNIEKIIENQKKLLKTISNQYHVELTYDHAFCMLKALESQQKTIEDMKCCGNCKHYTFGCIKDFEACSGKHLLWESKQ